MIFQKRSKHRKSTSKKSPPSPLDGLPNSLQIKKLEIKLTPKKILTWVLFGLAMVWLLGSFSSYLTKDLEISFSQVLGDIEKESIKEIKVEGDKLTLIYNDDKIAFSRKEPGESLVSILQQEGINPAPLNIRILDQSFSQIWVDILLTIIPLVLIGIFFYYTFKQAKGAQNSIFSFGKSKAKRFFKGKQITNFNDVAGIDEARGELEEMVDFLKHPQKYRRLGARTPKGVLLIGAPGTGKTLLARAMAGEADVPFYSMAGSEFMEMLVGVGSARMRDLFKTAKKNAPAIVFIDEIESIGHSRSRGFGGGHSEREQTLNQMLVEMDGFTPNDNVIVVGASVVGETPILIKDQGKVKMLPIGKFVDYYFDSQEEGEKVVEGIECLGFERKKPPRNLSKNLYFKSSAFKKVNSVFRHKVKEVYEISYLGGKIKATGSHSVFIRTRRGLETKPVSKLVKGDVLVNLPLKVNRTRRSLMEVRAHQFNSDWSLTLPFFNPCLEQEWQSKYFFAIDSLNNLSGSEIGGLIGVSQGTVSNWQRGIGYPRLISKAYYNHNFSRSIKVTPSLCRLFGYYVAEGYARKEVDFCFSIKEKKMTEDLVSLFKRIFSIEPSSFKYITHGAVNIVYNHSALAKFFIRYCGKGARNKHIPAFLFEAPREYFFEFLRGVWLGDGYEGKDGRGQITSVSEQLINEFNWLCRMHGMKTYKTDFWTKEGRRIRGGKPLASSHAYRVGWGKVNNPFSKYKVLKTYPVKRAIVKEVKKIPFKGFVYDLCGVENEAFFGGESPILLHNTNRPDLLDSALMRPGRFDRRIVLNMPDIEGRQAILKIHAQGKPFTKEVNWKRVAKRTVGFSGADLENMLNEAAILAARNDKKKIDMTDLEEAATKVKLGSEHKRLQSDQERKTAAYHEAGHALVANFSSHMDPVSRISIVARGLTLGHTMIAPTYDRHQETRTRLLEQIAVILGGRAAEEEVFSETTTGAVDDIKKATYLARRMVVEFGMSSLGPVALGSDNEEESLTDFWPDRQVVSNQTRAKIDGEINTFIRQSYQVARHLIKKHRKVLDKLAEELIKQETLDQDEFEKIVAQFE